MKCVKFIGLDGKQYAISCTDYEIVENAEDDKRIYYIQNGNAFMVRFSIIVFRCDNYIPET